MSRDTSPRLKKRFAKHDLHILTVVRDHMSGLLYAVPHIRALRMQFPQARISLLANSYAAPILDGCPYLDSIIPFFHFKHVSGASTWFDSVKHKAKVWSKLIGRVDIVVHFRYVGGETLMFCEALGRPFQIGYDQEKFNRLLNLRLGIPNMDQGSRHCNTQIIEAMGIPAPSTEMEMWIRPENAQWADQFLYKNGWQQNEPLVVLHPGCHWGCNEWLPERWAALGNSLQSQLNGRIVITGAADEIQLARQISQGLRIKPIIAAGETTLPQLSSIINRASLVVSVDTVPTQICQAMKIPSVILMGAGNPAWNGPLPDEPMIMLQEWDPVEEGTQLCNFAAGFCHGLNCRSRLIDINVDHVLQSVETVLSFKTQAR